MTITVADPAKDLLERLCAYHNLVVKQFSAAAPISSTTGLIYSTVLSFRLADAVEAAEKYNAEVAAKMLGPRIVAGDPDFRPFISAVGWPSPYDSYAAALRKYRIRASSADFSEDASAFQRYLEKDVVANMIQFSSYEELDIRLAARGF